MLTSVLETLLSNFPVLISLWTALTLCWGIYTNISYIRMLREQDTYGIVRNVSDQCNLWFMIAGNTMLASYLLFEPQILDLIGESIVVVNIFFCTYLASAAMTLSHWFALNLTQSPTNPLLTP